MPRHLAAALIAAAALVVAPAAPVLAGGPATPGASPVPNAVVPTASAGHPAVTAFGFDQGWRTDKHLRLMADLTGDGRADIVGFGEDGVYTAVARADGTFAALPARVVPDFGFQQGWRIPTHPRWATDITGDGRADLVGIGNAGVFTAVGLGDGTFGPFRFVLASFGATGRTAVTKFFATDTNGDGRADLVSVGGDHKLQVARANTDGTFAPPILASTAYDFVNYDFGAFQVVDVTGDGRAEVLAIHTTGPIRLETASVRADGTYAAPRPAGAHFAGGDVTLLRRIADVTGDGRADLVELDTRQPVHGTYVARSLGDGTFTDFALAGPDFDVDGGWNDAKHPRLLADVTGGGAADIVGFGYDDVYTAVARGDGTFATAHGVLTSFGLNDGWQIALHPRVLADVTGDGRADIVGFGSAGVYTALATGDGGFVEPSDSPVGVTVPDVLGRTRAEANVALTAAGLHVTAADTPTDNCDEKGRVTTQNPVAGTLVARGTAVRISIGVLESGTICQ